MPRSRLALGGAIAVVLGLALVALLVVRDGDGELASSGPETSTTVAIPAPQLPAAVVPGSSTVEPSSTSRPPVPATTIRSVPTTRAAATTGPPASRLTTTAGGHGPVQAALTQARQRWQSSRPAAGYVWSYENDCRCSPRRVEVTVGRAGSVTAVRELDGPPSARPVEAGLSVDGALAEIQAAIDADVASISVQFDPALGFPSSYLIDRSSGLVDEERGLTVLTFTPGS